MFEILEKFKKTAGFFINYDKTLIYRIGSAHNTNAKLITQKELMRTNDPKNVLGVSIAYDTSQSTELNHPLINKVQNNIKELV